MAVTKTEDRYANLAALDLVQTVADTTLFKSFAFPFSIQEKVALVIHRLEYWFTLSVLNTTADYVAGGIACASNLADETDMTDSLIIDQMRIIRTDLGAAASGTLNIQPIVKDFGWLPGGGMLVAPAPLYGFIASAGAGAVATCVLRMFYTYKKLATEEYWELVESRRVISGT